MSDAEMFERALGLRAPELVRGNLDKPKTIGLLSHASHLISSHFPGSANKTPLGASISKLHRQVQPEQHHVGPLIDTAGCVDDLDIRPKVNCWRDLYAVIDFHWIFIVLNRLPREARGQRHLGRGSRPNGSRGFLAQGTIPRVRNGNRRDRYRDSGCRIPTESSRASR